MHLSHQKTRAAAARVLGSALGLAMIAIPALLHAQTATIIGWPVNFDTVNTTGQETHGFEIEVDGVQPSDVTRVFGGVLVILGILVFTQDLSLIANFGFVNNLLLKFKI